LSILALKGKVFGRESMSARSNPDLRAVKKQAAIRDEIYAKEKRKEKKSQKDY